VQSNTLQAFSIKQRPVLVVLVLAVLVNIAGIGLKYFTDDPALYSVLARQMARTGNFNDLVYLGKDWLDKPHFPFWVIAISFKLFGVNTIAYKLPALLFYFMSVAYTYKLAKKFYGREVALVAVLVLLTAQHTIMSNTDVRAEPYIMGLLTGAIYHFYTVKQRPGVGHLLLACLFTACAVMTKGIYLLIPIGAAILGDYIFKKDVKGMLQWRWLLAICLSVLFILPELYTLYTQFDMQPQKVVFGRNGVSGIHWFLWDSQFGRFNNTGPIKNTHGSIFFFAHTLLWAFLPWALVFFYALYKTVRNIIKGVAQPEYLCLSASVVMLLIFSVSKFQLPFYTNILFPFFAIITANFVVGLKEGVAFRFFELNGYIVCGLLFAVLIFLSIVFAPEKALLSGIIIFAAVILAIYVVREKPTIYRPAFLATCVIVIAINTWLIAVAYPTLISYKGDVSAAEYLNKYYPGQPVSAAFTSNGFNFYLDAPVKTQSTDELLKTTNPIFTNQEVLNTLLARGARIDVIRQFNEYPKENLVLPFIIKGQRASVLKSYYIIKIKQ
jgi:4-amino-4-deoxy-L-arabinose transferase-like glycosyltransferase